MYTDASRSFNYDHPALQALLQETLQPGASPREQAVAFYYRVRDGIRYNPYVFEARSESFSASDCLQKGESYCIPKAVLLGALCRGAGIPSRLGLADVKNHLASPALLEYLRSDVFVMHGYTEIYLEGKWVKATPAFDAALCQRMGVAALEFDGLTDSVFQPYNLKGEQHMEYLAEHGVFEDVPVNFIVQQVVKAYPHLVAAALQGNLGQRSLQQDLSAQG
ncbi:MAG: transglutaminase family protein [Oceanospirillaceae bacterium]|nr:transglutaminase family protein [Oceanospirillaceae bacterium]MCP5335965.1 transglutaminase family protein [Oceanospirillaceae bacterium]MCP5350910.1 transglutaminase family protein [Oceanospirillaceae bacterium]